MATGKEVREALRRARKAGCTVEQRRNSHWRISNGISEDATVSFSPGSSGAVAMSLRIINKKIEEIQNAIDH
jgi:molybdopterin biosynthesis enzyme MoaB